MSFNDFGLPMSFGGGRKNNATKRSERPSNTNTPSTKPKSLSLIESSSTSNSTNGKAISRNLKDSQEEQKPMVFQQVRHFEEVDDDEDVDDFDSEVFNTKEKIPIAQTATMKSHKKAVTAICIDPSGTRLVSGSSDSAVKFWDFQGMDESLQPFRSIDELSEDGTYAINHLAFSNSGDKFILADNSSQAILFDRDGIQKGKFKKGDKYIVDMSKTSGHTSSWTGVCWHPDQSNRYVISSSLDSTVRVWDMETFETKQKSVFKARNAKGMKSQVTSCCYNSDGKLIGAGCADGSIQIWKENGNPTKCDLAYRDERSNAFTSIFFHSEDQILIGRDETSLKVFDIRKINTPLNVLDDIPNMYQNSNCIFSPLGTYAVTVVSSTSEKDPGSVVIYDWNDNKVVDRINLKEGVSPIQVRWHPILNQIFIASTDHCINGYYDKEISVRGLVTSMSKEFRKKNIDQIEMTRPEILTPYALPLFKDDDGKARKEKLKKAPKATNPPPQGPGVGGRVSDSVTHYLMKGISVINQNTGSENARQAILRHAEEAEKNPLFISPAYQKTQPKAIFAEEEEEEEEENTENDTESRFQKKRKMD